MAIKDIVWAVVAANPIVGPNQNPSVVWTMGQSVPGDDQTTVVGMYRTEDHWINVYVLPKSGDSKQAMIFRLAPTSIRLVTCLVDIDSFQALMSWDQEASEYNEDDGEQEEEHGSEEEPQAGANVPTNGSSIPSVMPPAPTVSALPPQVVGS